ncbi:hypothetical protein [Nocardia sp. NPDC052566]|uniref:hypothetical protein n=1 Tax=Nocardia sp. NPDC052566 TaxID=3364330 RepID=UPI0037CA1B34
MTDMPGSEPIDTCVAWPGPFVPEPGPPDARFVAGPDTAPRLARATSRALWRKPGAWRTVAVLLVLPCLLAILGGDIGRAAAIMIIVLLALSLPVGAWRSRMRLEVALRAVVSDGAEMTSRFGAHAFDIQTVCTYEKFSYRGLMGFDVYDEIVLITYNSRIFKALPRELFPDDAVAMIRQRRGQPGLG